MSLLQSALTLSLVAGALAWSSPALACGIEGSAVRGDGSKVDGTARVSTSWNSEKAFPRNGRYTLDLGSAACGQRITVYVDGDRYTEVKLPSSGNARLDLVLR